MRCFAVFFSFILAAVAAASNVVDLTPQNWDDVVLRSGKPTVVEFFVVSFPRRFSVA
jgi:protein disulfide-isomerase A6